ncbi:MAG: hypothetical protein KKI08_21615 [Armatimonadetes bacterium]|nr:hypothetical protein [Armatimonadota bacterium]
MAAEKPPCPQCGAGNYPTDRTCLSCGASLVAAPPPPPPPAVPPPPVGYAAVPAAGSGSGLDALVPTRNPQALGAYYIGLFSLIPILGLPMGIMALVMGIKGLQFGRTHPGVHGTTHAWVGIICGGFWALVNVLIVIAIISAVVANG